MFGYVNISQGTVSDEDKKLYYSYNSGLCKAIGKKSQLYRMTLSNDLTFLAILLSGVGNFEPKFVKDKHCIVHPVKKHTEILSDNVIDYVSDMNILLVYLKVCDDVIDDRGTSFLLFVMVISIILFTLLPRFDAYNKIVQILLRMVTRLALLPVVAGLSYEVIKLAGRSKNKCVNVLTKPGLWLQKLTTREPDEQQIEVAIVSMQAVIPEDKEEDKW